MLLRNSQIFKVGTCRFLWDMPFSPGLVVSGRVWRIARFLPILPGPLPLPTLGLLGLNLGGLGFPLASLLLLWGHSQKLRRGRPSCCEAKKPTPEKNRPSLKQYLPTHFIKQGPNHGQDCTEVDRSEQAHSKATDERDR